MCAPEHPRDPISRPDQDDQRKKCEFQAFVVPGILRESSLAINSEFGLVFNESRLAFQKQGPRQFAGCEAWPKHKLGCGTLHGHRGSSHNQECRSFAELQVPRRKSTA